MAPQESVNSLLTRGRTPIDPSWEFSLQSLPVYRNFGLCHQTITTSLKGFMSTNNPNQESLDVFLSTSTPATAEISMYSNPKVCSVLQPSRHNLQPTTVVTSWSPSPTKQVREEDNSTSESNSNSDISGDKAGEDNNTMDFQHTEHITAT